MAETTQQEEKTQSPSAGTTDPAQKPLGTTERDLHTRPSRTSSPGFRIGIGVGLLVLLVLGYLVYRHVSSYESTDDAQVDGHVSSISARVSGHVVKLNVQDNQYVQAGTVLVEIDPADYQIAVATARADYQDAQASAVAAGANVPITSVDTQSQLSSSQADVNSAGAGIQQSQQQFEAAKARYAAAQANDVKAQNDVARYKQLVDKQEISQQQYDQAVAAAKASTANVAEARATADAAGQQVTQARGKLTQAEASKRTADTAPKQLEIIRARAASALANAAKKKAALDQAELNLQYTKIVAPVNGIVSNRTVEVGQNVGLGQELLKLIALDDVWITANFKETQLREMKVGQRVTVKVDATGRSYDAKLDSLAGASGARFSLLPPENATGNYVKVVQRIPVKIVLEPGANNDHLLRPGDVGRTQGLDQGMSAAAPPMENADLWRPAVNPWIIALAVTLATFMEVLDTSIANVALPHIAGSLSAGQDESTWVLTSYLVSNAIVLPLSGWLSSIMGRKNFYMSCVALFTVSSFMCGLAPNLATLIICRVLQGAGGGGLQPSEQAILADTFAPAKRGMAFAVYGIAVVTAPAIGPTLGGWITDNFTWRWIFFINIPVGILSILLTSRLIQDPPHLKRRKLSETKIDYVGLGFVALGLGALQIVLDKGQREDWFESNFILILTIVAAAALIFVIFWEWRHKDPIIDLHLFRDRTFGISNMLMFMLGFALLGSTLLLPLFMQTLLGYTAEQSGLALMPGGFTIMLLLPLVGFLLSRYSPRWLLIFGLVVLAGSLFHMTSFDLGVDFRTVATARVIQAVGMAFLFVPINTAAYAYLPRDKNNAASGLMNLARNMGGSVGISVVTTLLDRRSQVHMSNLASHLSAGSEALQNMVRGAARAMQAHGSSASLATQQAYALVQGTVQRQATMLAYIDCFWLLGIAILAMIPMVFLMKKGRPGGNGGTLGAPCFAS